MAKIPSGIHLENITCTEQSFPEFPDLLFGTSNETGDQYFDATDYLEKLGVTPHYTVDDFMRNYFHPISALVTAYELDKNRVSILDVKGHTLLHSNLVYLFISYTNPDFLAHLNDRVHELFTTGVCVSDTYLLLRAKSRLTPEIFNQGDNGKSDKE